MSGQSLAKLYAGRLQATGEAPSISPPTNADGHQISAAVRSERRAMGLIGPDLWTVKATDGARDYALPLAKGDRVRLFHSTGAMYSPGKGGSIGRNGSVLEVIDANAAGLTLKAKTGKVGVVDWNDLRWSGGRTRLAYGEAMTIQTAQGSTAKEHIFALPAGSQAVNGLLGYTANTRHRHVAYLITSESAERADVRSRRPMNDTREVTVDDRWANVARALSYQPEKDRALALLERVNQVRRGTVRKFQEILLPAELQKASRQSPSIGHEIANSRKVEIALAKDAPRLALALRRGVEQVRRVYQRVLQQAHEQRGPSLRM